MRRKAALDPQSDATAERTPGGRDAVFSLII